MNQPLFIGVNARCRHNNPIPEQATGCTICEWEDEILSSTPPFDVECIDDKASSLHTGRTYTVMAVIRDGAVPWGEPAPGVLLESNDLAYPHLYKADRFILKKDD